MEYYTYTYNIIHLNKIPLLILDGRLIFVSLAI